MTSAKLISGVYAAAGTPRDGSGRLDEAALQTSLEFLMERGIRGFALNGATGEYCLSTADELARVVDAAREVTDGRAELICGIGSAGIHGCLENAEIAVKGGAKALLLPMPHFFPYAQTDLKAFCRAVAKRVELPILLYNLPFSSPLEAATVEALLDECPNIIGIKDSSGSLTILQALTATRPQACRIVGSDGVLEAAIEQRCLDGVISGVASVLPGLILSLYRRDGFKESAALLNEFISALSPFPVPWGLKLTGEILGIIPASFSQPLSAERLAQADALRSWLAAWQGTAVIA